MISIGNFQWDRGVAYEWNTNADVKRWKNQALQKRTLHAALTARSPHVCCVPFVVAWIFHKRVTSHAREAQTKFTSAEKTGFWSYVKGQAEVAEHAPHAVEREDDGLAQELELAQDLAQDMTTNQQKMFLFDKSFFQSIHIVHVTDKAKVTCDVWTLGICWNSQNKVHST